MAGIQKLKGGGCWSRVFHKVDPEVEKRREEEEKHRAAMKEMFESHDEDGSGTIDAQELEGLLGSLGFKLSSEQVDGVLEEIRFHAGDQEELDFEGFMKVLGITNGVKDLEMKQVWPMFDSDGDGQLDQSELRNALDQCGIVIDEAGLQELWEQADDNENGVITLDEFCRVSSDGVWKKAISMMMMKKQLVGKCVSIADKQKEWVELLESREDAGFIGDRARIMRRAAMRESPQIKDAIWELWTVLDGLRVENRTVVHKNLFDTYFLKIGKALLEEEFDLEEMQEMAEEEWERQIQRGVELGATEKADGIYYPVFFESMFELVDNEVSRQGAKFIQNSVYAAFVHSLINKLMVEKICNATKRRQAGEKNISESDKLGRNWVWLEPNELNFTGITEQWESFDRKKLEIAVAEEEKAKKREELRKNPPKLSEKSNLVSPRGLPKNLFDMIDVDGNGVLDFDELKGHLSDHGLLEETIEMLLFNMDENQDGVIDREEFDKGYEKMQDAIQRQATRDQFAKGGTLSLAQ